MHLPKGFGKNYFTLRAITATTNQVTLNANAARVEAFHMVGFFGGEQQEELEEEDIATLCTLELSKKPCHCNCYYLKRTKKILQLFPSQKLDFYYFKSLKNAVSPPFL
ncbi:hypothetical protein [Sulfurimonas sp.]|uniref:hypothetical protein n=1 Tax=Sulfurimonas sp. TaxID=2022749 RepID=UPI0025E9D0C6|nr:hypothetical protein [Sulfurimonas sp.]MDD5157907.1 hypothetical protein [Sulfurimonas sp.]